MVLQSRSRVVLRGEVTPFSLPLPSSIPIPTRITRRTDHETSDDEHDHEAEHEARGVQKEPLPTVPGRANKQARLVLARLACLVNQR